MPKRGKMNGENPPKSSKRDKLSNLPSHIIGKILSRLPIRDAMRTSVLSSKWRFKWTTMPDLVFDKDCFSFTPHPQGPPMMMVMVKRVNFINHALLLHTGPISKFMLYQVAPISSTDLDSWILHLSKCLVQELILEIREGQLYKLHSCLFSFEDLVHLELYRCHLKLPSAFGGFKKLKSLNLRHVTVAQDVLETLISSCPILEKLTLAKVPGLTELNIDAPNLLDFAFEGSFDDISFINSSNLEIVTISSVPGTTRVKDEDFNNLLKFFCCLSRIKRLQILGDFMVYLALRVGDMPEQLPNPCLDLGYLFLNICISDPAETSAALCLLRSSPNIQELDIAVPISFEQEKFTIWESEDKNCSFNKLRMVRITGISGNINELEFIRFMLLASPVLQKMTIKPTSENQGLKLARELLRFQRASTKAEVVFL